MEARIITPKENAYLIRNQLSVSFPYRQLCCYLCAKGSDDPPPWVFQSPGALAIHLDSKHRCGLAFKCSMCICTFRSVNEACRHYNHRHMLPSHGLPEIDPSLDVVRSEDEESDVELTDLDSANCGRWYPTQPYISSVKHLSLPQELAPTCSPPKVYM